MIPVLREDVVGVYVGSVVRDSGTWSSGGDVGADAGEDGARDGVGWRHWCTKHILEMAVEDPPPTAALAAEQALASARDCCHGGSPTCAECLGIAEDSTSELASRCRRPSRKKGSWRTWALKLCCARRRARAEDDVVSGKGLFVVAADDELGRANAAYKSRWASFPFCPLSFCHLPFPSRTPPHRALFKIVRIWHRGR